MEKQNTTATRSQATSNDLAEADAWAEALVADQARLDRFLNDLGIKADFDRIIASRVSSRNEQRRQG